MLKNGGEEPGALGFRHFARPAQALIVNGHAGTCESLACFNFARPGIHLRRLSGDAAEYADTTTLSP